MAQYLREPLFVLEVNTHNDAHVQRYSYQDYTLPNGDTHETGRGGALDDASAKNMLAHYASLHVLPTMLVLKRHEGHFYGVHHGELATRWQAEGDLVFANENCSTHSWFDEIVAHNAYSTEHMGRIDVLNDEDVTNAVIIGATERRDRLDIIHDRLRLPRLDREPYDIAILDSDLQAEANRLHKQAGPARPASTDAGEGRDRQVPDARTTGRAPISTQGRVALQTMQRILDSMDMEPEFISDRSKMRQLQEENDQAAATWRRRLSRARTPDRPPPGGARDLLATVRWLLPHRDTLHDLLGYLPYPEVAVKMMPTALLQQWGELEVYDSQTSILRAMLGQESIPDAVRVYCRTWLAACTTEGGSTRDRIIAKDVTRWVRLANMHAAAPPGARPATMSDDCWHTLHILPYVIWVWGATPWGGASRSALSELYRVHPALQQLCEKVTGKMEWGDAVVLPSGITWEDRLTAMEAGQPAPPRC
ncbi:hypothetical protein PR001_g27369 [Phytophthora rubi]|uniref:Uncharacterized protein n=2 Tax=Phytophthora rubi TaxID=129364 RepID=A0A6A3HJL2_9STRA|nr:hypothetical protein PR002_g27390 [Phytophthora rubi]KAE8969880.1 hypothetical protein PR001_g27369 [Phytophthora rubi]